MGSLVVSAVSQRKLHMIGNAHIDPVWLWQWPEGYQEVRATFHSALDRMNEYPDFVFTHTSVLFLQWVEESDPELFEQICALDEYYPTRTEIALLRDIAPEIAQMISPGAALVEFGSGASVKTRLLRLGRIR